MALDTDSPAVVAKNPLSPPAPLPVEQALQQMLAALRPLHKAIEELTLARASGRVLAAAQQALVASPPADNSAMDGYAARALDWAHRKPLPVSQYLPAGAEAQPLDSGTAVRIFTGAPLPKGADAVLAQELAELSGAEVMVAAAAETPPVGCHVRRRGEDFAQGARLLPAGRRLFPQDIGLLAAAGIASVPVYAPLRVAVLSTGDELLEPGAPPTSALRRPYNSNRPTLIALLGELGMEALDGGIAPDDRAQLSECLDTLAEQADCIISTGGVSVGDRDMLRRVVTERGETQLWQVAIKPGKPLLFGSVGEVPLFALPGNPAAVFICFRVLVRSCLLRLQGAEPETAPVLRARAVFSAPANQREEYLRASLRRANDGEMGIHPLGQQSSGALRPLADADCLARIPAGIAINAGDWLEVLPLRGG